MFVALSALVLALSPDRAAAAAYVPPPLLEQAEANPAEVFRVIVVGTPKRTSLASEHGQALGRIGREFSIVRGVSAELRGAQLVALAQRKTIVSITPDAAVRQSTTGSVWPQATGIDALWGTDAAPAPNAPTIAVVDSGIEPGRTADFGDRVVASVNLNSREPGATGDDNGHGTLVAGFAAGASAAYPGAAPNARLVALDVVDRGGMATTADVIAAADWVYANREQYDIRVVNISLVSAVPNFGTLDPISVAYRRLWLTGTVVVAAAGNDGPQSMLYAPASDPFLITVGAADTNGTVGVADDFNAPWSSFGHTAEGFAKPELSAPGRYVVGPVPAGSMTATALADRVVAPGYMWISGTSFAAPIVAGTAAQLLARHPDWTPDQVKGALMLTARGVPNASPLSLGVGEINASAAAALTTPPNPNENLYGFVAPDATGDPAFDANAWAQHVSTNASWTGASWTGASWTGASWTGASWTGASWTGASWTGASWTGASWTGASWTGASWTGASWTGASWTGASWTGASWTGASWTGASWTGASWTGASWTGASWTGSSFQP